MAASGGNDKSREIIAMAFQQIADNAARIGQLNVTPDLLTTLMHQRKE
jgi:hypothetical protein